MKLKSININCEPTSIEPTLVLEFELTYEHGLQLPINVFARVFTEDSRLLGIAQLRTIGTANLTLEARETGVQYVRDENLKATALLPITARQLDHLESVRAKHPKRDVVLTFKFDVTYLESSTLISGIVANEDQISSGGPVAVAYKPPSGAPFSTTSVNMWILSGNGSRTFLRREVLCESATKSISSGDWLHDFLGPWNSTNYVVIELPQPQLPSTIEGTETRISAAVDAAKKASDEIERGEWTDAVEDLRLVWELLRKNVELPNLLLKDGYTQDAVTALQNSINYQFDFASKFFHRLDKSQQSLIPELIASKEDALLCFSFAMSLLNLVARKTARLSQRS